MWVYPSENLVHCPMQLVDKYISLLPPVTPKTKKFNFYLRSLEKVTPAQWYGKQVVRIHKLKVVVKKMLKDAKFDGFFTNHSLRCTSTQVPPDYFIMALIENWSRSSQDTVLMLWTSLK